MRGDEKGRGERGRGRGEGRGREGGEREEMQGREWKDATEKRHHAKREREKTQKEGAYRIKLEPLGSVAASRISEVVDDEEGEGDG